MKQRQLGQGSPDGPDEIGFDAISEVVFKDDNALVEMSKISAANRDRDARHIHSRLTSVTAPDGLGISLMNSVVGH